MVKAVPHKRWKLYCQNVDSRNRITRRARQSMDKPGEAAASGVDQNMEWVVEYRLRKGKGGIKRSGEKAVSSRDETGKPSFPKWTASTERESLRSICVT